MSATASSSSHTNSNGNNNKASPKTARLARNADATDDYDHNKAYAAPTPITTALVPDGKLVDVDTAEVTALPTSFFSNGSRGRGGNNSSSEDSSSSPYPSSATTTATPATFGEGDRVGLLAASAGGLISRPNSANAMTRVKVQQSSNDSAAGMSLYSRPPLEDNEIPTERLFAHRGGAAPYGNFNLYRRFRAFITQLIANTLSSVFLILVVIWALSVRMLAQVPRILAGGSIRPQGGEEPAPWDDTEKWKKEDLVKDVRYYAANCGFEIQNETVETADGYYLRMHKVIDPTRAAERKKDGRGGYPVLIMHGLFQSSGSFVTSEERSLAFWLARHGGYQVYLGNARGVFDMGHKRLSRSDPRFWDYNIRELAIYDLPALVDHVRRETGYDKIAYLAHSQGNATGFIALSQGMVPELGEKLTYFGALAPAVFAGPLTSCFPFTTLGHMDWKGWKRFFGVLDFIPLMKISYDYTPAWPYALLGYQMFAFLFAWTDANWLLRRKAKMFRFTPQPVSSTSIYWWAGKDGFASRGCILDPRAEKWWDHRFPPLSIYSGGMDFLVLTDPLVERLEEVEKDVRVLRYKRQEEAEHCDHFWAAEAVEWCFHDILEDIEVTREMYPEEREVGKKTLAQGPREDGGGRQNQDEEEEHRQKATASSKSPRGELEPLL